MPPQRRWWTAQSAGYRSNSAWVPLPAGGSPAQTTGPPRATATAVPMSSRHSAGGLTGRRAECEVLDRLVADARAGRSRTIVVRGEAGIGKTALLEYVITRAGDDRVARAAGVESEMELAYAGLQQLCAPFLDRLARLPAPQAAALGTAFGLRAG